MKLTIVTRLAVTLLFFSLPLVSAQSQDRGRTLYEDNCAECHGKYGKGDGPAAAALGSAPPDFTQAVFWRNNVEKKIRTAVEDGYGAMPPVDLKPDEIKAIADYMTRTFKKR